MSTNHRWIISTPRSSQNLITSPAVLRVSILFLPPLAGSRGLVPPYRSRLAAEHPGHVRPILDSTRPRAERSGRAGRDKRAQVERDISSGGSGGTRVDGECNCGMREDN